MSDDILTLVPRDPFLVPRLEAQTLAIERLRILLPDAEKIDREQHAHVRFFDCGENFQSVSCPHCRLPVDMDWWQQSMSEDSVDGGFRVARYALPCCHQHASLNELHYDWPQAFGRFAITALNPGVSTLPADLATRIEDALGCSITAVRGRI